MEDKYPARQQPACNRRTLLKTYRGTVRAGWEVFGIKYVVHEPLSTVLNQVAEGSYQAVASLLWKLKRAEHSLSAAWLALNGMQRSIGQASAVAKQHNIYLPGMHPLSVPALCHC